MDLIEVSNNHNRHPWELSRTHCVIKILRKYDISGCVLDIGCGDSYFDEQLVDQFDNVVVHGVDINLNHSFQSGRVCGFKDICELPADVKYDCILMMDVLEHIEFDFGYLESLVNERLSDNGILLITVPAFMKLYSKHDEELKHFRRYNHRQLRAVIDFAGLREEKWTYFYFSLIFLRLMTMNKTKNLSGWAYDERSFKTKFVKFVLDFDFNVLNFLSKIFIHLPGLSLLSVCRKANTL